MPNEIDCTRMQMMRVDVTKYNKRFGIVKLSAKAYVGPDVVCEAELTLAMGS
jgi:3-hydroxyacyl-[acyl-carrier-protein] dehydratase